MRGRSWRWGAVVALAAGLFLAGGAGLVLAHPHEDKDHSERPWLGVVLGEAKDGVRIVSVVDGSPAEAAGLQSGDLVTAIDGRVVADADEFMAAFRDYRPGDSPGLTVHRDGNTMEIRPVLEEKSDRFFFNMPHIEIPHINIPNFNFQMGEGGEQGSVSRGYLGVQLQSLTDGLREYFGAPEGEGVLVAGVEPDSPAERAGLRAGDVITAIDGQQVAGHSDLVRGLADLQEGDAVQLTVYRDRQVQTIQANVGVKEIRSFSFNIRCDGDDEECEKQESAPFGDMHGVLRMLEDSGWQQQLEKSLQEMHEKMQRLHDERPTGDSRT